MIILIMKKNEKENKKYISDILKLEMTEEKLNKENTELQKENSNLKKMKKGYMKKQFD